MQILTFDKKFLLEKLTENRKRHKDIYNEALIAYRQKVLEELERVGEDLAAKVVDLNECLRITREDESRTDEFREYYFGINSVNVSKPSNHLIDYDRTILMVENCQQNDIELTEQEYTQYVMDNWDWQQQFMTSNSGWSGIAASGCVSMGYSG
ncbi:MAG: hypothetical protein K5880_14195 [Hydrogenophaga sp.]|uniref:hypothetical protein n=1 Tax=Hydrogenophaga sp. TaxID=1904254 RepID=UPI002635A244|nr:hypothetical protein [Hydrogenophaga sp.]MCV0439774.1 hypothetical protein [Hydrogenophaga sp.]